MRSKQLAQQRCIADIAAHKDVARIIIERGEVFQIPCVGQLVQIDHGLIALREPVQHKVRTDKTRTASH